MYKKTVSYEDWNGNPVVEDLYFNLTRTEILELEYQLRPGTPLTEIIQSLIDEQDSGEILRLVKEIVLASYGKKSEDGKRFTKNDEIRTEFEESPAFDVVYMDLASDTDAAIGFINGIMPKSIQEQLGDNPQEKLLEQVKSFQEQQN